MTAGSAPALAVLGMATLFGALVAACSGDPSPADETRTPTPTVTAVATEPTPAAPTAPDEPTSAVPPAPPATQSPLPAEGWSLGSPVPLPDGLTLVLGTGCWRCGGQYSTYIAVDSEGTRTLYEGADEIHIAGSFEDPSRIHIAACRGECSVYDTLPATDSVLTTLYESVDRGRTWSPIDEANGMYQIAGQLPNHELVLVRYVPQPEEVYLFPSGAAIEAPPGVEENWPFVHEGALAWRTEAQTLVDSDAAELVDFASAIPEQADVYLSTQNTRGDWFLIWLHDRSWGTAVMGTEESAGYEVGPFVEADAKWLDDRYLVASIEYTREQLTAIGADPDRAFSRTPSLVDIENMTVHPLEEMLKEDAPSGRNRVEALWLDE